MHDDRFALKRSIPSRTKIAPDLVAPLPHAPKSILPLIGAQSSLRSSFSRVIQAIEINRNLFE
jgi:hypothetical protein